MAERPSGRVRSPAGTRASGAGATVCAGVNVKDASFPPFQGPTKRAPPLPQPSVLRAVVCGVASEALSSGADGDEGGDGSEAVSSSRGRQNAQTTTPPQSGYWRGC